VFSTLEAVDKFVIDLDAPTPSTAAKHTRDALLDPNGTPQTRREALVAYVTTYLVPRDEFKWNTLVLPNTFDIAADPKQLSDTTTIGVKQDGTYLIQLGLVYHDAYADGGSSAAQATASGGPVLQLTQVQGGSFGVRC
jgi:hypothetical protein